MKNKRVYNFVIVPLVILISAFIRSACVQVFIVPYNFAPGGSTGLAAMIQYATRNSFDLEKFSPFFAQLFREGFPTGFSYILINAPLIAIAWIFIDNKFAIKTGAAVLLASVGMILMQFLDFPRYENGEPVLAAAASGVLGGVALAMMLKIGGSTGGSDILAMCIQKKLSATNVAWFIYAIDAIIVFISAFVFKDGLNPILLSLAEMFCLSMTSDVITSGFKTALKFEIITKDPDPLANELLEKLGRGVTCTNVTGMYSHDDKYMLICIIRKHQLSEFNKILQKYPDTFAYLSSTREVMGLGFSR